MKNRINILMVFIGIFLGLSLMLNIVNAVTTIINQTTTATTVFQNSFRYICRTTNVIHTIYLDGDAVKYANSTDGVTWRPAFNLTGSNTLDDPAPSSPIADTPSIACSGNRVFVAWGNNSVTAIMYRNSTDEGVTWNTLVGNRATYWFQAIADKLFLPSVAFGYNGNLWMGFRVGLNDVNVNVSNSTSYGNDLPALTHAPIMWSTTLQTNGGVQQSIYVNSSKSNEDIWIAYKRDGRDSAAAMLFFNYSRDGGATWNGTLITSNTSYFRPNLYYFNNTWFVVAVNSSYDIILFNTTNPQRWHLDSGDIGDDGVKISNGSRVSQNQTSDPSMTSSNNTLYIFWSVNGTSSIRNWDIEYRKWDTIYGWENVTSWQNINSSVVPSVNAKFNYSSGKIEVLWINRTKTSGNLDITYSTLPAYTILRNFFRNNVIDIDDNNIRFDVRKDTDDISNIFSNIVWNGTTYNGSKSNTTTIYNFTYTPTTNISGALNQSISFNWRVIIEETNSNTTYSETSNNQTIYNALISFCNATVSLPTLRLNGKNEETRATLNMTKTSNWDIWINVTTKSYQLNATNTTDNICIYPAWANYTSDNLIIYSAANYDQRSYNGYHMQLSNASQDIDLYLLNTSKATRTSITTKDTQGYVKPNIYIKVQRYYPELNSYLTTTLPKTGFDGKTITYLNLYDTYYKFLLEENGRLVQAIAAKLLDSNDITLVIEPSPAIEYYRYYERLSYSCAANNSTKVISCTLSDTSGSNVKGCLNVSRIDAAFNSTSVYSSCTTSSGMTLGTSALADNKSYVYTLSAYLYYDITNEVILEKSEASFGYFIVGGSESDVFGGEGIWMLFLVIGTIAFIGLWSPTVAVLFSMVALIGGAVFGLLGTSQGMTAAIVGMVFVGIVIIWKLES